MDEVKTVLKATFTLLTVMVVVTLVVDLPDSAARFPETAERTAQIAGITLPRLALPSAAAEWSPTPRRTRSWAGPTPRCGNTGASTRRTLCEP